MLELGDKWAPILKSQPETGMGYCVATVSLRDGRKFEQVVIVGGVITEIAGDRAIPFAEEEITDIRVTHDKYQW